MIARLLHSLFCTTALLLAGCAVARAEVPSADLPFGTDPMAILKPWEEFVFEGVDFRTARVPAEGAPFDKALQFEVLRLHPDPWDIELLAHSVADIPSGKFVYVSFWARCLASGDRRTDGRGKVICNLQREGGDYLVLGTGWGGPGRDWTQYDFIVYADQAYPAGSLRIAFPLSEIYQTIEVGGLEVRLLDPVGYKEDLPVHDVDYPGRAADAQWRSEARQRIEKIRKAGLKVEVVDSTGKPVDGAAVRARMTRHEFLFGTAVNVEFLNQRPADDPDLRRYKAELLRNFNGVVIENALKWPYWNQWRDWTLETLAWLDEEGMVVRGHPFIWPGWGNLPSELQSLSGDPDALRSAWQSHAEDMLPAVAPFVDHWDVINEPMENHALMDILGNKEMAEWFKAVRARYPHAPLLINETGIIGRGGIQTDYQDNLYSLCRYLQDLGAPIDGVGLQCHMESTTTPPERVLEIIDRYASLGMEVHITEFDAKLAHPELQRDYMRDFMTAVFSHPNVESFLMWGFWDGMHWLQWAPMFRRDWTLRPMGQVYRDLVFGEWWTDVSGITGAQGTWETRGFRGNYVVEVEHAGRKLSQPVVLGKDGATVRLQF